MNTKIKFLVCGGRDYTNYDRICEILNNIKNSFGKDNMMIIHGDAKGADRLAGLWAKNNDVEQWTFPADWDTYKKAAGPIRNKQMLDESKPNSVIAFPGGAGTANMIQQAKNYDLPVIEIDKDKPRVKPIYEDKETPNLMKWFIT